MAISAKVEITHPTKGKQFVSRQTLGIWRRNGWSLVGEKTKTVLNKLRESKEEEVEVTSAELDDQEA
jgi:hypothetical protein